VPKLSLALAEARKNNWTMAPVIVDGAGNLVYFEKRDNTQIGSVKVFVAPNVIRRPQSLGPSEPAGNFSNSLPARG
jgi:hypothetical protein